jgi:hypothetical protein
VALTTSRVNRHSVRYKHRQEQKPHRIVKKADKNFIDLQVFDLCIIN